MLGDTRGRLRSARFRRRVRVLARASGPRARRRGGGTRRGARATRRGCGLGGRGAHCCKSGPRSPRLSYELNRAHREASVSVPPDTVFVATRALLFVVWGDHGVLLRKPGPARPPPRYELGRSLPLGSRAHRGGDVPRPVRRARGQAVSGSWHLGARPPRRSGCGHPFLPSAPARDRESPVGISPRRKDSS